MNNFCFSYKNSLWYGFPCLKLNNNQYTKYSTNIILQNASNFKLKPLNGAFFFTKLKYNQFYHVFSFNFCQNIISVSNLFYQHELRMVSYCSSFFLMFRICLQFFFLYFNKQSWILLFVFSYWNNHSVLVFVNCFLFYKKLLRINQVPSYVP